MDGIVKPKMTNIDQVQLVLKDNFMISRRYYIETRQTLFHFNPFNDEYLKQGGFLE
jgi:hypothetical protein